VKMITGKAKLEDAYDHYRQFFRAELWRTELARQLVADPKTGEEFRAGNRMELMTPTPDQIQACIARLKADGMRGEEVAIQQMNFQKWKPALIRERRAAAGKRGGKGKRKAKPS